MKIIESLKSVYDKKSCFCLCNDSEWEIKEDKDNASFRKVVVRKKSLKFEIIGNDFFRGMSSITSDRSSFLKDKDCDGVSFYEQDGKTGLMLIDLKSSFSEDNISKAFTQDFHTFLKLHMMMSICKGYRLGELAISCYAACPPCASSDVKDSILDTISMSEEAGDDRFINRCLKSYLIGGEEYSCALKDTPFASGSALHEDLMNTIVSFHIFCPACSSASEGVLCL